MSSIKIIVEKHDDGYVGYPVGMRGIVVGDGDTYADALGRCSLSNSVSHRDIWR